MKKMGTTASLTMQSFLIATTPEESDRIRREYSAYFEKVEDQEYSPYHTTQGVEYQIPELDYYHTNT